MYKLLSVLLVLMLCGCGPRYANFYSYQAPDNARGKSCVVKCLEMKQYCEAMAEQSYNICLQRVDSNKKITTVNTRDMYGNINTQTTTSEHADNYIGNYECQNNKSNQINTCLLDYNACFQLCGGVVNNITKCVANCE